MSAFLAASLWAIQLGSLFTIPPAYAAQLTADDYKVIATADAEHYGIDVSSFLKTIDCESQFNPMAISKTGDYGIAQIHEKAHLELTKSQLYDPFFSLDWAAHEFSLGHQRAWVCYSKTSK